MVTTRGSLAEFVFYRPRAEQVCIVGDFNGWRDGELPMSRTPDGNWIAHIYLPTGDFRFRYRADGEWFVDYAAFGIECGQFGPDSVVHIDGPARAELRSARRTARSRRGALGPEPARTARRRTAVA